MPTRFSSGFTLVELMVSLTLGLGLMSLMVGTIDGVLHASRVSAESTEAIERGYFLMDALDNWVAQTSPTSSDIRSEVSAKLSAPILSKNAEASVDICGTPVIAALPPASAGIALLEPGAWPCIPQHNLEASASALFIERRAPCPGHCNADGFYFVPKQCTEAENWGNGKIEADELGLYRMVWIEAGTDRFACLASGVAFNVTRSLIYIRDYSWREGDGVRAVMVRELAREPEARWLRASMLAHGIDDWQVECLPDCLEVGDAGAFFTAAVNLSFAVNAPSQSISIQRVLVPQKARGL